MATKRTASPTKKTVLSNWALGEKLNACLSLLNTIIVKEDAMAGELAALQMQVTRTQETEASAILLIQNLAQQIATLSQQLSDLVANGATPAQLAAITTDLNNSAQALAAAIAANTTVTSGP